VQHFVLIGQTIPEIGRFFIFFFENGSSAPSWNRYVHVWTTGKEYFLQLTVGLGLHPSKGCG